MMTMSNATTKIRSLCISLAVGLALTARGALAQAAPPLPKPDPGQAGDAPGVDGFQELVNALSLYVLLGCLVGGLGSLLLASFGGFISDRLPEKGKMGVLVCVVVAFVAGIIWAAVGWAYDAGAE